MHEPQQGDGQVVTVVKLFIDFVKVIMDGMFNRVSTMETQMAKLTEVQAKQQEAIVATQAAVVRVVEDNTAQNVEIQKLKDQIAAGGTITESDLDSLIAGNQTIIDTMNALDPIPPTVEP